MDLLEGEVHTSRTIRTAPFTDTKELNETGDVFASPCKIYAICVL
jgi:hypothetical protein